MATFTQKDEFGRFFIDGMNGKLSSDMFGRYYGEAIDRFAEFEHGKEKTSCTYYVVFLGLTKHGNVTGETEINDVPEIKTYQDILEMARSLQRCFGYNKVIILNYVKIESAVT